jgi:hypothetical protein
VQNIDRSGIDPKWERSWTRIYRNHLKAEEAHGARFRGSLEEYVAKGTIAADEESSRRYPTEPVAPPHKNWETPFLAIMRGNFPLVAFEDKSLSQGKFDTQTAQHVFASFYTFAMVRFNIHGLFPTRYGGRRLQRLSLTDTAFTALGVIIGCRREALRIAQMQLAAIRKNYYYDRNQYPIFQFVLRILASYLGEIPPALEGTAEREPIFQALFDLWRVRDPDILIPFCLAACDFHTHRVKTHGRKEMYEFNNRLWSRTPFEILLLFKLRQMIGLENPQIDHPLMNSPLGVLPPEVGFEPDDLLSRVRERMMADGYDEDKIYAAICSPEDIGDSAT